MGRSKDGSRGATATSARAEGARGASRAAGTTLNGKASHLEGRLNAAHASPTALAHASPYSAVGQIAAYKEAMKDYLAGNEESLEAAANALAGVANKGISAQTVTDLNAVLGLSAVTDDVASQIADTAKAAQANNAGSLSKNSR